MNQGRLKPSDFAGKLSLIDEEEGRISKSLEEFWSRWKFPKVSKDLDELWGAYGALGYEGVDGQRAKKALESMERVVGEITRNTNLRFA